MSLLASSKWQPCGCGTHPELINHEVRDVLVQLVEKRPRLLFRKILEAPLEDSATIWVCRELIDAPTKRAHKAKAFRNDVLDDLLDNLFVMSQQSSLSTTWNLTYMVAVRILDTAKDVRADLLYEHHLVFRVHVLYRLDNDGVSKKRVFGAD